MEDSKSYIDQLRTELKDYVNLRMELTKLVLYEKSAKITAQLSSLMVMAFLGLFFILFIFLALANYIGELLQSLAAGYGLVAFLYLIMLGAYLWRKDTIEKKIMDKMIDKLTEDDADEANQ